MDSLTTRLRRGWGGYKKKYLGVGYGVACPLNFTDLLLNWFVTEKIFI